MSSTHIATPASELTVAGNFPRELPCDTILGTRVNALNMDMAVAQMEMWIRERISQYVCVVPAHSIIDVYNQPALRPIFNASGMNTPDGMSVVWLLRLKGYPQVERVYGPDLLLATCQHGLKSGYRHYFYGGAPGVAEKLSQKLSGRFPELQIAGVFSPPFLPLEPEEDEKVIQQINQVRADVIWVGLSSPKQEIWMREHFGKLNAPVMVGIGAAFDFLSGTKPQAPVWIQRSGLEWLFRLASEPKRLWPRYRQYPRFLLLVLAELLGVFKTSLR